jgi:hypothetical protein
MTARLALAVRACRRLYFRQFPHYRRVELRLVGHWEGNELLSSGKGWQIAVPEEDRNYTIGMVYLERRERVTE